MLGGPQLYENLLGSDFAYRTDNEYSIDNTIAERTISRIVLLHNGSIFFGSVKEMSNSAVFNTSIETCK